MMGKRAELELLDAISVYFHHAAPGLGPDVESIGTSSGDCVSGLIRADAGTVTTAVAVALTGGLIGI
jgi:hypothetical protein